MEVDQLQRMEDRGMNLAIDAEGFGQPRGLHHPGDAAGP
jgi:hypothetical protein